MAADPVDALLEQPAFAAADPAPGFLGAAQHCLALLTERFPRYARFLSDRLGNVAALPLTDFDRLRALPPLFLPVLKTVQFDVPAAVALVQRLTSSGTTGKPSVTPQDEPSWRRRVRAMAASYRGLGVLGGAPVQALAFLNDPATTAMAGSLVIDAVLRGAPEVKGIRYLARMGPAGPSFELAEAVALLRQAAEHGPVLVVGYPALIAAALGGMKKTGFAQLPLPSGSRVLTGGGWKSFLPGVRLEQEEFRQLAADFFGLPAAAIRDMYGLSECPAVFVQCAEGNYHVPGFALAEAIDPETGAAVPDGEVGLLQLTVPLTTSYPLLKILTTDRAVLGRACPCGLAAPHLTPRGRVTAARFETCAMKIGRAVA